MTTPFLLCFVSHSLGLSVISQTSRVVKSCIAKMNPKLNERRLGNYGNHLQAMILAAC